MSINFWDDNMGTFWEYVRLLLDGVAPGIMLTVATVAVGLLLGIVVKGFRESAKEKDDEEDYEIKHY